jgi:hypothetical protein
MDADRTVDMVVLILTVGLVGMGLVSMAIGRVMSRGAPVPDGRDNAREHGSYAAEPDREPSGTGGREPIPALAEQLTALDDNEVLAVLALIESEDGEYRYADSRIAKFIPGRVEDRIDQVRAVRGVEAELAPPGRLLRVRDEKGERVIPFSP